MRSWHECNEDQLLASRGLAPLIGIVLVRALGVRRNPSIADTPALHAALIAAVAVAADLLRPAQWILSLDSRLISHASYGPSMEWLRQISDYFLLGAFTHCSATRRAVSVSRPRRPGRRTA